MNNKHRASGWSRAPTACTARSAAPSADSGRRFPRWTSGRCWNRRGQHERGAIARVPEAVFLGYGLRPVGSRRARTVYRRAADGEDDTEKLPVAPCASPTETPSRSTCAALDRVQQLLHQLRMEGLPSVKRQDEPLLPLDVDAMASPCCARAQNRPDATRIQPPAQSAGAV